MFVVFAYVAFPGPVDEDAGIADVVFRVEGGDATHCRRLAAIWTVEASEDTRVHACHVEHYDLCYGWLVEFVGLAGVGTVLVFAGVVVKGDYGVCCVFEAYAGIVLPEEGQAGVHSEIGIVIAAAEFPEYAAVASGEFVYRAHAAGGDEVVAVEELVDGVEVEEVPFWNLMGVVHAVGVAAFVCADAVFEGFPVEEDFIGGEVDFLEAIGDDGAVSQHRQVYFGYFSC